MVLMVQLKSKILWRKGMTEFDFDDWYKSLNDFERAEYNKMIKELHELQEELKEQKND